MFGGSGILPWRSMVLEVTQSVNLSSTANPWISESLTWSFTVLYQPYPSNWPIFTGKDKLASWFEQYAETQDLVVWLSSTLQGSPTYDKQLKRWNLTIKRQDTIVQLNPVHLIVATGYIGDPIIPTIPRQPEFRGEVMHAEYYAGGAKFKNRKVIVVGAGNTSHDICQDLVHQGAASVTMIQRSSTLVISHDTLINQIARTHPDDVPAEINDFKFAAMPIGLTLELSKQAQQAIEENDKEMLDGLRKAGFQLNTGIDGYGVLSLVYATLGGMSSDIKC